MERTTYARLYATAVGTLLVLLGFAGMLVNTEFNPPELTSDLLGFYTVNGWANAFHVLAGLLGLVLARPLPRLFALIAGLSFTVLGVWGIVATNGTFLFDALPATRWVNLLNLLIGFVGIAAFVASRWERIIKWSSGLGTRFEARTERRRQKRRRKRIRKRRSTSKSRKA